MRKILGILGPTCVGKSQVGMLLATKLKTEIISADSAQIYKGMDIGTAKPSVAEQNQVRHHLIDLVQPDNDDFNAFQYSRLAEEVISANSNNLPLIVGGTGLYFETLIYGLDFKTDKETFAIRNELKQFFNTHGEDALYDKLKKLDPESSLRIHKHNAKGVMRAIEIAMTDSKKRSQISNRTPQKEFKFYVINQQRDKLYDAINDRVDKMIDMGLFNEVEGLLNRFPATSRGFSAIGYKEIIDYFLGKISKDESINLVKQHTRNYAKRQLTFFKRLPAIWIEKTDAEKLVEIILEDFYDKTAIE